jgi:hypothetical protein
MLGRFVNQEVFIVTKFGTNLRRLDRASPPPPLLTGISLQTNVLQYEDCVVT